MDWKERTLLEPASGSRLPTRASWVMWNTTRSVHDRPGAPLKPRVAMTSDVRGRDLPQQTKEIKEGEGQRGMKT